MLIPGEFGTAWTTRTTRVKWNDVQTPGVRLWRIWGRYSKAGWGKFYFPIPLCYAIRHRLYTAITKFFGNEVLHSLLAPMAAPSLSHGLSKNNGRCSRY